MSLLREMEEVAVDPTAISYKAGISACEKGGQWLDALSLLMDRHSAL